MTIVTKYANWKPVFGTKCPVCSEKTRARDHQKDDALSVAVCMNGHEYTVSAAVPV